MKNRDHKTRFGILLLTVFWLGMFPAKVRAEENAYTDRDLMVATQIAYYDFTKEQLAERGGSATVRELLNDGTEFRELESKVNLAEEGLKRIMAAKDLELCESIASSGSR